MGDILKEAIADAKAVRETALENAKMALEEAFTPQLKSMLSAKLKEDEIEESDPVVEDEEYEDEEEVGDDEVAVEDDEVGDDEVAVDDEEEIPAEEGSYSEDEEFGDDEVAVDDEEEVEEEALDLEAVIKELESELSEQEEEEGEEEVEESTETSEETVDEITKERNEGDPSAPAKDGNNSTNEEIEEEYEIDEAALTEEEEEDEEVEESVSELSNVQAELKEYKEAVSFLKDKLHEVNILNAKLLFTNKLFKQYSLDNNQKLKVVETFDRAQTTREIKLVYSTLAEQFNDNGSIVTKKSIKESASAPVASTKPSKESKKVITEETQVANRFKKLAGLIK